MDSLCQIDWVAAAAWVQAGLMAGAILAAVGTPYLAAHIDRQRRGRAAFRLAELTVECVQALVTLHGAAGGKPAANAEKTARSLNLPLLVERMAALPSTDFDDADALDAFVRINGVAQAVRRQSDVFIHAPTVDHAAELLVAFPELRDEAEAQLDRMRKRIRPRSRRPA